MNERFDRRVLALPCLSTVAPLLAELSAHEDFPTRDELQLRWGNALRAPHVRPLTLTACSGSRRRPRERTVADLYDGAVVRGEVPTRERCWHDLFNVAAFAAFPRSKRALHERQHQILLERLGTGAFSTLPNQRSREQDTLTLLDEGGLLLAHNADDASTVHAALGDGDALSQLAARGRLRPHVLGHALHEHAARTATGETLGPAPRALCLPLPVGVSAPLSEVDGALERLLQDRSALAQPPSWAGAPLATFWPDSP